MKYARVISTVAVLGFLLATSAIAEIQTLTFDPDDLIQAFPSSPGDPANKTTQVNARRVHEVWASSYAETFNNVVPHNKTQPDSYNTYMNWRDGLGENEGISAFNIWLLDNPRARSWGETTVWDPLGAAPSGTADADGKWNVEVDANPWGPGWIVQWSTDDPANYINTLSDIGEFSFSGTMYHDNNANGYDVSDPLVENGDIVRTWFGAVNWTEFDEDKQEYVESFSVHFDADGWGTRTSNDGGPWSSGLVGSEGYGSGYEGALEIQAVPVPGAVLLGAMGLGMVGWMKRRKTEA